MNSLKNLVSVVDAIVILWFIWLLIDDPSEALILGGLILLFGLHIYLLSFSNNESDWFGLFLKRKALEEKKRIAALETK
ncbi:hypothetical protein HY971_03475 [Candidatus Kaiserbacteria bacterium]|nr:hypothetical protein [Candidatus Kaiserbacteria bacterium]